MTLLGTHDKLDELVLLLIAFFSYNDKLAVPVNYSIILLSYVENVRIVVRL